MRPTMRILIMGPGFYVFLEQNGSVELEPERKYNIDDFYANFSQQWV